MQFLYIFCLWTSLDRRGKTRLAPIFFDELKIVEYLALPLLIRLSSIDSFNEAEIEKD